MGDEREIRRLAACNEKAMETTVNLSHRTRRERDKMVAACNERESEGQPKRDDRAAWEREARGKAAGDWRMERAEGSRREELGVSSNESLVYIQA